MFSNAWINDSAFALSFCVSVFQWGMERHQIMNAAFHPKSAQYMLATMGSELQ
jgi:hypothetical protein